MQTDVLIVGAGPTGLMLAIQLVRRGVRCVVIDQHSGPAQQTRAMAVHARTLEIYAKLGLAERAIALGRPGNGANLWSGGKLKARIPLRDIGEGESRFPFVLMLGQDDNERLLGEHLRTTGLDIAWSTRLTSLTQTQEQVSATLESPDGPVSVTARYIAGCDGAHSAVRNLNEIGFPGAPYEQAFFVADTEAVGPMVAEELNVFLWRHGFHLYFPMRGADRWRVIGMMPATLADRRDLGFEDIRASLQVDSGIDVRFRSCLWFSAYRIHHRCTERFRRGRCFLLGDAAHIHSPMGGQGMNTGLQDAYNLAWKLAVVIAGEADEALLDSYEAERMPVAQNLLRTTDRAFRVVIADGWSAAMFRTRVIGRMAALAMSLERVRKLAFKTISQLGINYRASPLSRQMGALPADAPQAGDRFPWMQLQLDGSAQAQDLFEVLDDVRFHLLLIDQPTWDLTALGLGDRIQAHRVSRHGPDRLELGRRGITAPAAYLLRPDGHVALAGAALTPADLRNWLAACGFRWTLESAEPAAPVKFTA